MSNTATYTGPSHRTRDLTLQPFAIRVAEDECGASPSRQSREQNPMGVFFVWGPPPTKKKFLHQKKWYGTPTQKKNRTQMGQRLALRPPYTMLAASSRASGLGPLLRISARNDWQHDSSINRQWVFGFNKHLMGINIYFPVCSWIMVNSIVHNMSTAATDASHGREKGQLQPQSVRFWVT